MIEIRDSLRRKVVPLEPLEPPEVRIYLCGVTPYAPPHIGHARGAVIFDAFTRFLSHEGFSPRLVRNITDIDDKIIARAGETGEDPFALSSRYAEEYGSVMRQLFCAEPDREPTVSGTIPEIIGLIERLIGKDLAYESGGDIYYRVRAFGPYGALSGRKLEDMRAGYRIEPGEKKEDAADFALWKAAKEGEPSWDSPWGRGRPGWHIECSAMAMKHLGEEIDIHGGGSDLIFPHHENEIAQSEGATGRKFARIWMHNGMLMMKGEKMSKSMGNVLDASRALERHGGEVIRFFLLSAHYTGPLDCSDSMIAEAGRGLERIENFLDRVSGASNSSASSPKGDHAGAGAIEVIEDFVGALRRDFNTPRAISVLFTAVKEGNEAIERGDLAAAASLASSIRTASEILGIAFRERPSLSDDEMRLVEERSAARAARDFEKADRIRKELLDLGIVVEDTPEGPRARRTARR